ncbi:MAG: hypothetical protein GOU98_00435 [Candidatus Altiarchaeota archaeon]|nr:hypothetical protein [Candidatus Altiarchaeota archaeon]
MDLTALIQAALAFFYLMLTIETLVSSTKNFLAKQLPFEGRILFLAYSHMVYFGGFSSMGLRMFENISILDFLLNRPIVIAYDWINAFTVSFFGLSFKTNPFFMFTYLIPIFFVYNFVEYWFRYGFSDKRISKLISFAAVILYISSNNSLGLIDQFTTPYAGLFAALIAGGGIFGMINMLISLINVIPIFNLTPLQNSISSIISYTLPMVGVIQTDSGAEASWLLNIFGPDLAPFIALIAIAAVLAVVIFVVYTMYKYLIWKMTSDAAEGKLLKTLQSSGTYISLSYIIFGAGFTLMLLLLNVIGLGKGFTLDTNALIQIPLGTFSFVLSFILIALFSEVLVFAAMLVLFNNMKYVFKGRASSGGGGGSGANPTETTEASGPTQEEIDADRERLIGIETD